MKMKKILKYARLFLMIATAAAKPKESGNSGNTTSITVVLTPRNNNIDNTTTNATIIANTFGYVYTWPSNSGVLEGINTTFVSNSESVRSCVQTCHRKGAPGGMFEGKSSCKCVFSSPTGGNMCLKSTSVEKGGLVFSMHPKPNNCFSENRNDDNLNKDHLQLLPDFILTFTFHLPQNFHQNIDFADFDEKLITRRIQLHLGDAFKEASNGTDGDVAAYVYMKPTSTTLISYAHSLRITTISRKFSGFLKFAPKDTDVTNITSEAFQPNNIYGAQFLVDLLQDSVIGTTNPNSNSDSTSILQYLYDFSFSIASAKNSDGNGDEVLVRVGNHRESPQPSTESLIITISLVCGAFAFGLIIGGFLLLIQLNNRREYGKLPIVADRKPSYHRQTASDKFGLNDPKWEPPPCGRSLSTTTQLSQNDDRENDHVRIAPVLKKNNESAIIHGSISSFESSERCIMIERSYAAVTMTDGNSVIEDNQQMNSVESRNIEDIHSEAVEVSECGIGDYYALLEDLDLHENLVLEETDCYGSSSFYKHDGNSDDNNTSDSSTAHPSVCSLEKIIVNAKIEPASQNSTSSSSSSSSSTSSIAANLKMPKTPDDTLNNIPIKMIELTSNYVSPSSVICDIPDNDDLKSFDEKESSARVFESVWNESDDETLQSYIPRIIQIPNVPSQEEDQEVFLPPQIRRQDTIEFVIPKADAVHVPHRAQASTGNDVSQKSDMKMHHSVSEGYEHAKISLAVDVADAEQGNNLKIECEPSADEEVGKNLHGSDSLIFGIADKSDSDGDSSAVMFSSVSYQASFMHGSTCRESFPSLLPMMVRGKYDDNSIASLSESSPSDLYIRSDECAIVSCDRSVLKNKKDNDGLASI